MAAMALAVFADAAQAQRRGRGSLIGREQVQKELKITDDQKTKLDEIQKKQSAARRELFSGVRDLPRDEQRAKYTELRGKSEELSKKFTAQANEVLNADQKKRLQEISIQVRGSSALSTDDVAKALGLSEEQSKKLRAISEDSRAAMRKLFEGDREGVREKFTALRKEAGEKMLAVLTADQKEKFEKMKGKKFELERRGGNNQNRRRRPDA
jgi:Spy/CpxP family protein refolding chaperone